MSKQASWRARREVYVLAVNVEPGRGDLVSVPRAITPCGSAADDSIEVLSYAYRAGFVARYAAWPACPLETTEALEQLRVLWHGEKIAVLEADQAPPAGVDTPEDLERVRKYFLAADEHK